MGQTIETSLLVPWAPRVLVADPDELCRRTVQSRLEALGLATDVTTDPSEAFELSGRWPYAAVFMDCGRPAIEGHRAARAIRSRDGASQHALLVAVTAHPRHACLAAGMDHHVAKPVPEIGLSQECRSLGLLPSLSDAAPDRLRAVPLVEHHRPDEDPVTAAEITRRFLRRTRRQQPRLWRAINAGDVRALSGFAADGAQRAAAAGAARASELFWELMAAGGRRRFSVASAIEIELRAALVDTAMSVLPILAGQPLAA
jgi:CheY-like chemotaxis protein